MSWVGFDPGGENNFGFAFLNTNGSYETGVVSSASEALDLVSDRPLGVGIDAPLWWSAGRGGGRYVDEWIRKRHKIASGTVQSVNSLRGAVLVQGYLIAHQIRVKFPDVQITESHPKALIIALDIDGENWSAIETKFQLARNNGYTHRTEHERDALIAAVCARDGFQGKWSNDLAQGTRGVDEESADNSRLGNVSYYWPFD